MLVAPNKTSAIRYREYLKEIGKVSCEVLISPDDTREGNEDAYQEKEEVVKKFYKSMMDKYGTSQKYEKAIINSFKKPYVGKIKNGKVEYIDRIVNVTVYPEKKKTLIEFENNKDLAVLLRNNVENFKNERKKVSKEWLKKYDLDLFARRYIEVVNDGR